MDQGLFCPFLRGTSTTTTSRASFLRFSSPPAWRTTMGIKGLTKLLVEKAPQAIKQERLQSYFGQKIAIDASLSIYQFLGMFTRTIRLLEAGIKPVYVFDGRPPDLKKAEIAKRYARREDAVEDLAAAVEEGDMADIEKYSKRAVKMTRRHTEDCCKLLRLMGVPVVEAPSEAEAECVALCKAEKVFAVASEDMDSLTFGSPRFLRHLMEPNSRNIPIMEFEILKVLEALDLTMDQFIDMCLLCGCDYLEPIKGIGKQTALKLIRQHGDMETILEKLNKSRYQIPHPWPYQEARDLFKEPLVTPSESCQDFAWDTLDEEGLRKFLVKENSFSNDRVMKAIDKIKSYRNRSTQGR